jgi:hypothetical protein
MMDTGESGETYDAEMANTHQTRVYGICELCSKQRVFTVQHFCGKDSDSCANRCLFHCSNCGTLGVRFLTVWQVYLHTQDEADEIYERSKKEELEAR